MSDFKVANKKNADGSFTPVGPNGPLILQKNIINPPTVLLPADEASNLTIFYVSPDGNDENDGQSVDKPFEHIGKALGLSQRTLGDIAIRLKGALNSGALPVYTLPENYIPGNLYRLSQPTLTLTAWDFDSDSWLDNITSPMMFAAICPNTSNSTRAYVNVNVVFRNILLSSPFSGSNFAVDDAGLGTIWEFRGIIQAINTIFTTPTFFGAMLYMSGLITFYTKGAYYLDLNHQSFANVNLYNSGKSKLILSELTPASQAALNITSQSGLYITPSIVDIMSSASTPKKAIVSGNSLLYIGANINSLPGTGTQVDSTSAIV